MIGLYRHHFAVVDFACQTKCHDDPIKG